MMKTIKRISALCMIGLVLLYLGSCDDDSTLFTVSDPNAPVLADLGITQIELDAANTGNPAIALNWSESDYGQPTAVSYDVQFSMDEAFTAPVTATSVTGRNNITLSIGEVNSAAGNAGLNPFEWATLYTRVVASLGTQQSEAINSNTLQFEVFPFFNYIFNDYYLVGNGTAPGWDNNANNPPLFRDAGNANLYYYTGFFTKGGGDFNDGRFKVLEFRGLWQPQWGVTDNEGEDEIKTDGDIAGNPATQDGDPGRFGVPSDGYYEFTINFSTKKYTMTPFDASGATMFSGMSIQGSSVATTAMTQLTFDGHIWYAAGIRLTPGEVSFLTDTGATWGAATGFSGVATNGGSAIPVVVEDDYDVWFNTLTGRYILIPLNL
ncbi:SusE domain-containing protein [Hyunsoonleella pacifica]|uniref:SusF/SusE family outer membrane protein n=1 Tax=Hyunsoonleella pacifica TaxID=1080224 RepID=A0A4Q9FPD3_9FLAO|nr:SusE domain-containing protein [Hyunsoonleella pacifica]TBN14532.1 SusF/SusE family outer membrane protein [Hyunsoonleella pacifica]